MEGMAVTICLDVNIHRPLEKSRGWQKVWVLKQSLAGGLIAQLQQGSWPVFGVTAVVG